MNITVTGAAGQIAYAALFRIAAGDLLGADAPVRLRLLEVPQALRAAEAVAMELADSAFPLLQSVDVFDDQDAAFDGTELALLAGSRPRRAGEDRRDLLEANGGIFRAQGRAIARGAADGIRVLVVGNPANTNALVALSNAPDVPSDRFTAMSRLDHNRAIAQLSRGADAAVADITRVTIWGNHSATQYPDVSHALVRGRPAEVDAAWLVDEFVPVVRRRGEAILEARGSSSAASAASAALDHLRDWVHGTPDGDWTSAGLLSDGRYGIPAGLVSSFPVTASGGAWTVVDGLELDERTRSGIAGSVVELADERAAVESLGLI